MKLEISHIIPPYGVYWRLENKVSIQRMDTKIFLGSFWDTFAILTVLCYHIYHLVEVMTTSRKICLFFGHFEYFLSFLALFMKKLYYILEFRLFWRLPMIKRVLFLYYDEVVFTFEEFCFVTFSLLNMSYSEVHSWCALSNRTDKLL